MNYAISHNYLSAPEGWTNTAVQAFYMGVEVKNGGVADMWFSNFKVRKN